MANEATVADIVSAQEDASDAVDAQIQTTSDLQAATVAPSVFSVTFLDSGGATPWKDLGPTPACWNGGKSGVK